jgi:hypothetical protein
MYRCQRCHENVPACTPQHLLVETRPAFYPRRPGVYVTRADGKTVRDDDPGGTGREIARTVPVCPACAAARGAASFATSTSGPE